MSGRARRRDRIDHSDARDTFPQAKGRWASRRVKTKAFGKPVKLGTRFVNLNCQGWKHWPTTAQIVRFVPERDLAFRIAENYTVWSFRLEETDGGTLLGHRRETPDGISTLSKVLTLNRMKP